MPLIKANGRIMQDGTKMIQYTDTVGPSYVTYTLENEQESIVISNKGLKQIVFSVGATTLTINPGDNTRLEVNFTSFQVKSVEGIQQFEVLMDEVGTTVATPETINNFSSQLVKTEQQINKINAPKIAPIEIIAHRGFAGLAPENTISAYSLASSLGVMSLECDVQMTSDGIPVVIHDSTVDRTTNGVGIVKEMTLAQLQALDAGSKFSPFYAGSRIPTFDEFLKYAKGRSLRVYPEIKDIRSLSDIEVMVNVIKDNGMENVTVIQSFNLDHLLEVRKFSKSIKLGLLIYNTALSQYAIDTLSADGNAMVLYGYSYVISNPSIINQFYGLGIDLGVWVVPNRDVSDWLLGLGVTKQMFDIYFGGVA